MAKATKLKRQIDYFQLEMALNASSIVALTDARGIIIEVNQAFCDISQYSRDELIGRTHAMLKSDLHNADFYKNLWQTISSGDVWNGEICNRAKDGTLYWVNSTIIPARGQNGRIATYVAIRHDITAKKILEQKHQKTLQDLQKMTFDLQSKIRESETLFQSMTEGVVVHDADGRIIQFNQAALNILGLSANQAQDCNSFAACWHMVRENGQPFPAEEHPVVLAISQGLCQTNVMMGIQRSPDDLRWIIINASPIFESGSSKASRALATFRDITDQRQQEAHLIHASKLSSLGEVSAAIAHEINNPLTIIGGHAQQLQHMLESNHLNPELFCQSLGKINSSVLRITKIISGLKSFSRNSADDPVESVAVKTLVDNTLTLCQAKFDEYATQLKVLALAEGSCLECRASQISQVLLNLLNNALDAVQHNPEGERFVELDYSEDMESVTMTVSDNGPGIPPLIRNKIMEAFFTTKAPGKGTGLGLSISLSIVKKHQGTLMLDPLSTSTRFVVNLPKKQKNLPLRKASA